MESGERRTPRNPGREYVLYADRRKRPTWIQIVEWTLLLGAIGVVLLFSFGCAIERGCKMECVECGSVKMDCRAQGEPAVKP